MYNCSPCTHLALCSPLLRLFSHVLTFSFAQSNDAVMQEALKPGTPIEENLRVLTDEIGGRVPGTAAFEKAQQWAIARIQSRQAPIRCTRKNSPSRSRGPRATRRSTWWRRWNFACAPSPLPGLLPFRRRLHAWSTSAWARQRSSPRQATSPEPLCWCTAKCWRHGTTCSTSTSALPASSRAR